MSTTFFQVVSDDPQLEKQIGCMTGLLQLFHRQQALRGKRTARRISSGASKAPPTNNAAAASLNHRMRKTESSDMLVVGLGHRGSSSPLEQLSSTSHRHWLRPSSSPSLGEFKEAAAIGDPKRGGCSVDLKESLGLLAKLKEAPWNHNREASAAIVELPSRKDAPRLSYDACFELKDALRASQRARDAPRLSLDGRSNAAASRPSTGIRMRPTSNVVARLMGLEELPDHPCHHINNTLVHEEAKAEQGEDHSEKKEGAAAVGRKVKQLSSSPRYVMETMPRPPPIQDSKASFTKRSSLVAKANPPGFSQDMEKQMMYLRLEEQQRNILKDIVEVLHLKGLLHWHHGAAALNNSRKTSKQTNMTNRLLSAQCQANARPPSPTRDISHQNVRGTKALRQSTRAAVKQVKATTAARQQEMSSTRKESRRRAMSGGAVRATQVEAHLKLVDDAKETSTTRSAQRDETEPPSTSQVLQGHLDTTFLLFDDCHPRADQVEAYVKQILDAAGLLHGGHPLPCLTLNPTLFLALEKHCSTKVALRHCRLLFDCVNQILARQPCYSWRHPGGGQALVQQVVQELQQLPCAHVGEMLQDIVDEDVAAMADQACELALHVERLLFKQLVDEIIQDMTKLSSSRNVSARRQLFLSN